MTELHNINDALKYYRYYAAFCARAVDAMEYDIVGYKVFAQATSITEARCLSFVFLNHMDASLETFKGLCETEDEIRMYDIIMAKYIKPISGTQGKIRPRSNEWIAGLKEFNCSIDTVQRDVKEAKKRLKILFFGFMPEDLKEIWGNGKK